MTNINGPVELMAEYRGHLYVVYLTPMGHRCGYVGVRKGEEAYGQRYLDLERIACHGGLTYCADRLPFDDKPDGLWWIGFDCAHYCDEPDLDAVRAVWGDEKHDRLAKVYGGVKMGEIRSLDYCVRQCERIIDQLMAE
jgi:hypothetical protein